MALCINHNTVEYKNLKNKTGLTEFQLDNFVSRFLERYGRYPRLVELPASSLESFKKMLKDKLKIKKDFEDEITVPKKTFDKVFGEDFNIRDWLLQYLDLKIRITENKPSKEDTKAKESYTITIEQIPNFYNLNKVFEVSEDDSTKYNQNLIDEILDNILKYNGKRIIKITDAELNHRSWKGIVDKSRTSKAFIYNGNVYINVDHATIDDKVHELLHLLLGSLDSIDRNMYVKLIDTVYQAALENSGSIEQLLLDYDLNDNGILTDIKEEILVKELAKYLTGQYSLFNKLNDNILEDISTTLKESLDRIFSGTNSTTTIGTDSMFNKDINIFNMSLFDLAKALNDKVFKLGEEKKSIFEDAFKHRININKLNDLIKSNKLEEDCE